MSTPTETRYSMLPVLKLLWQEADGYALRRLGLSLAAVMLTAGLAALTPLIFKLIIDLFSGARPSAGLTTAVTLITAYVLGQFLVRVTGELRSLVHGQAIQRLNRRLSQRLFDHILRLPLRFHLDRKTGGINETLGQGLDGCQTLLQHLVYTFLPVGLEFLAITLVMVHFGHTPYLIIFALSGIAYAIAFWRGAADIVTPSQEVSSAHIDAYAVMTDSLLNCETVKYFTAEKDVAGRYEGAQIQIESAWRNFLLFRVRNGLFVATIFTLSLGASLGLAGYEVLHNTMTIGDFVLINSYIVRLMQPLETIGFAIRDVSQGLAFAQKMLQMFEERPEATPPTQREKPASAQDSITPSASEPASASVEAISSTPQSAFTAVPSSSSRLTASTTMSVQPENMARDTAKSSPAAHSAGPAGTRGELAFEHVSFSYNPDRLILRDISFTVPPGHTTAIVGASGSGKSSIIRLLFRLYDPDGGVIRLDGTPINDIPLEDLRRAIAIVPQDTVLFNDTIGKNIGFGRRNATQEDIEHAARLAHLHEFIAALPQGYDAPVGERGLKLSGGEKQRVAIARAALKRPRIFVFDEATSSLDSHTEQEILQNLMDVAKTSTTLMIAHRLSTIVHADEILVLQHGAIAERGFHAELLENNGSYSRLWRAQHEGRVREDTPLIASTVSA